MSSRQEEKERRRAEREAAEAEAARASKRRRGIGIIVGGLLAGAAVAAIVIVVLSGGGSSGGGTGNAKAVRAAAKAAGCTFTSYKWTPGADQQHTTAKVNYKGNPPSFGDHNPTPAQDGIYDPRNTPSIGMVVHALEHGRIEFQYAPTLSAADRKQFEVLTRQKAGKLDAGYHVVFFQNETKMPYAVAATAWAKALRCPRWNGAKTLKAMTEFRTAFTDKAPEKIP